MRVLINAWFWGSKHTGSGQYLHNLHDALRGVSPETDFVLFARTGVEGLPAGALTTSLPFGGDLAKLWFEQVAFALAARKLGVDVAHVPYWAPPAVSPVPTVVTIHDVIPRVLPEYRGNLLVRAYTVLVSVAARRASLILTDSDASLEDIVLHLGVPRGKVRKIWLAADPAYRPATREEIERVRKKYGLPESYLLYLGGFDVRKNLRSVIEGWKNAALEGVGLVIAGGLPPADGSFAPDPRRIVREIGAHGVTFPGWVDEEDKPAMYSGAVAFLFPSLYEGFGLPVLEAMSCGTPVIVSGSSSLPEVVGEAGVVLPPKEIEGWAEVIRRVVLDRDWRSHLSRLALERASRFSWEETARETYRAYVEVLRKKG